MSLLREKNFVRPNVGVPYTTTDKKGFDVHIGSRAIFPVHMDYNM